jgi:hypothetical protein
VAKWLSDFSWPLHDVDDGKDVHSPSLPRLTDCGPATRPGGRQMHAAVLADTCPATTSSSFHAAAGSNKARSSDVTPSMEGVPHQPLRVHSQRRLDMPDDDGNGPSSEHAYRVLQECLLPSTASISLSTPGTMTAVAATLDV